MNGNANLNENEDKNISQTTNEVTNNENNTNNVDSSSGKAMDITDSVQTGEVGAVNGDDGFGDFEEFNDQIEKGENAESGMDTNENDTELDNTMSPSEPQVSSADNVTGTEEGDSAEDKTDLDDRLASLAKASDLLHSIAQAAAEEGETYSTAVDFKEDADDVLENEVGFTV